jgi:hypothetical protein
MPSKGVHPIAHLHGVRTRLVSQRAVIIDKVSAFTLERGIAVRQDVRFAFWIAPTGCILP